MEKIQSAIAKARAARSAQPGEETSAAPDQLAPRPAAPVTAPVTATATAPVAAAALMLDNSVHALDVARHWSLLPAITIQPALMEVNRLPAFAGGPAATYFDMLRTRLLQQMAQNGWKRLAITSPGPACGKTTLALNLAFALGRRPDLRTILAEVDLRRPSAQKLLG
ncbi:MAG: exopolysaccharide biosynthesis protein, partial [Gemmobacter sp.]